MILGAGLSGCAETPDTAEDDSAPGAIESAELTADAIAAYVPPAGAVFNRPTAAGAGGENAIQNRLIELIDHVPAGAEIRVVMYTWREAPVADALIRAHARGARVKVLMNNAADGNSTAMFDKLRGALGNYGASAPSWGAQCKAGWGCLGTGINHNKFFLFSQVGETKNVVVQSSANLTHDNRVKFWNNAYTVADQGLYGLYSKYFTRLTAGITRTSTPPNDAYTAENAGAYKLYTFPRAGSTSSSDTIVNVLENVACSTDPSSRTRIRVAVLQLYRPAVASKLVALKNQGCQVYLAYESFDGGVDGIVRNKLTGIRHCAGDETVHSKYLLIEAGAGSYAGEKGAKLVFTGSHNYNPNSLRNNDETILRIDDASVYQQYEDNFDEGVFASCPAWP
ncbi:phospholipase D-like domain-containing protein [Pendulispora rubella]|uniref:phospholipase D n=1 Tax=Pendulispora rubella TaxID=2741070 RepID=A0ABZ2KXR7_9BACT